MRLHGSGLGLLWRRLLLRCRQRPFHALVWIRDTRTEHQILSNYSDDCGNNHVQHDRGRDHHIEVCKNNGEEALHHELLTGHRLAGLLIATVHLRHLEILQCDGDGDEDKEGDRGSD